MTTHKLPTKEQCDEIVLNNGEFKKNEGIVNGQLTVVYSYNLPKLTDFKKPFEGCPVDAHELRGLAFVQRSDGGWDRFLLLRKFWELNQTDGQNEKDYKDKKIVAASRKEDGSIIRYMSYENGEIGAHSMGGVVGYQVERANKLLEENPELKAFVKETLEANVAAVFELVGPDNQVVLKYDKESLRLLQLRDENTGEILPLRTNDLVLRHNVQLAKTCELGDLEYYIKMAKEDKGHEGFVLTFDDGSLLKIKLAEYKNMHGIILSLNDGLHKIVRMAISDFGDNDTLSFDQYMKITKISDEDKELARETYSFIKYAMAREILHVKEKVASLKGKDRKTAALELKGNPLMAPIMRGFATDDLSFLDESIAAKFYKDYKTHDKAAAKLNGQKINLKSKKRILR